MVETKRKQMDVSRAKGYNNNNKRKGFSSKPQNQTLERKKSKKSNNSRRDDNRKKRGPRLPSAIRKEIGIVKHNPGDSEEDLDSDQGDEELDPFELEDEPLAEEDLKKNRRFDPVDNLEYKFPEEFEDENLLSEDDESGDEGRHARMLQGITKMPAVYFEGKKIKTNLSESYPKSEINPSQSALDGGGRITMSDLLEPLQGMPHFHSLRKDLKNVDKNSNFIQAPLPKGLQDKAERIVAYKQTKKDITRWEPIVKRNREAPTLFFDKAADVGSGTVGALASRFEARTDFEKKMALHVCNSEIVDAHNNDGARLLELNKISVQDVKDRQNHLAKMRSLLFRHELKAKHIKKIKSKTYHNLLKKDRSKVTSAEMQLDPEAAKEHAMKQEYKRAEERMTLKHKNNSKWAKRILERGLSVQDDGTRASISQQLHQHTLLTRKMNSMKDTSSSDDSSEEDDDDDLSAESDEDGGSKLLTKAKEKTLKVIEEEDEIPRSGVFSLPFMERGLEKRKEEAYKEAKLALEEYELSLNLLESTEGTGSPKVSLSSGRRVFGAVDKQTEESNNRTNSNKVTMDSDSENDFVIENNDNLECVNAREVQKSVNFDTGVLRKELGHEPVFESIDDIVRDSAPKTTYEVAIFASDSSRKLKGENIIDDNTVKSSRVLETFLPQEHKEQDEYTDTESVDEMVDGTLSSGANQVYELPSQADLIRRAFAGDDVEDEFVKDKMETLNEENPEPEKPAVLPGWGDWTGIQQKRGLPSWMVEKHENATKKREEDIKRRKDANLEHVIITETIGKKSQKLFRTKLPFPYTSVEAFERSMRVPLGPDFNPASTVDLNNRPAVVKIPGTIIRPVKYEDVDPYGRGDEDKTKGQQAKKRKTSKSGNGKALRK